MSITCLYEVQLPTADTLLGAQRAVSPHKRQNLKEIEGKVEASGSPWKLLPYIVVILENQMETTIVYWGVYRDNGKENGNY